LRPGGRSRQTGIATRRPLAFLLPQRDDRPFYEQTEVLDPDDIADGVAYMVTRPCHTTIGELWIMPTDRV
jgi:NADP-dependent 3-hydroxy acid dehydrogenase YdfG